MSIILLTVTNQADPNVLAVQLDDQWDPDYREQYVEAVRQGLDPDAELRWTEVDVYGVSEYGPSEMALFLTPGGRERVGVPDLSQRWEVA